MTAPTPWHDAPLILFDGACGTTLQQMQLDAAAWEGHEGCNEILNLTAPDAIMAMHQAFIEAGARVIETNTFGANRLVLGEYGLADRVAAINEAAVAHARCAAGARGDVAVCGSIGPGTKLALLGQVDVDSLAAATTEQVRVLVESGVDLLLFETCQDLLQIKTALVACFDELRRLDRPLPVLVSVTVESTGTLLAGSDLETVAATLAPFPLFSLGLNCAAGPDELAGPVAALSRLWPGRISVMPNAGLPVLRQGRTHYPLDPEAFAAATARFVRDLGVSVVGGCCGTTPAHVAALRRALAGIQPAPRALPPPTPAVTSAYAVYPLHPEIPPFLIGERLNANGSKAFRDCLLADALDQALPIAARQADQGAMALDVCAAYAGRSETDDLTKLVALLRTQSRLPVMIDSTRPEAIEAALRQHPGRCIINSINLEDGGATLDRVCTLARRYGAAVVALTIHEDGMALTVADKVATAKRIHARAVGHHGLRPADLLFDALTFTIGSGDASLRNAAAATLEAIRRIKEELPGVGTVLGVSNISYGLAPGARRVLNSVFLHEAVAAGLDAAIVDVARILPLHLIDETARRRALDLIYNRETETGRDPLHAFIEAFAATPAAGSEPSTPAQDTGRAETRLTTAILRGDKEGLAEPIEELLPTMAATDIVNAILVPAMREVGRLFGCGEMLLPFVLQSAEAMKAAVKLLEPALAGGEPRTGPSVLLATVAGDVHDIGKNLVDIILTNNGYTVHNIGTKVPAAVIIEQARRLQPAVIGLSGLLVKSALLMRENLAAFKAAGLTQPVLLGGAALTPDFVARECAPVYDAPVVYCADAFDGLRALRDLEAGRLSSTPLPAARTAPQEGSTTPETVPFDTPIPQAPFLGARQVHGVPLEAILPFVNEPRLFATRWGYHRRARAPEEYAAMLRDEVRPRYREWLRRITDEAWLQASVSYGYFRARAAGESLTLDSGARAATFAFPRQGFAPHRCIADFFRPDGAGDDLAAAFVVTVGDRFAPAIEACRAADRYQDYLMLHGLAVELTEALAEGWHRKIRRELGIGEQAGARYGFGYPACPDLDGQRPLLDLLDAGQIGVALTEGCQMVPEFSTAALVVHHPQAHYFTV
ncbi:MAG: dihydropteroate synthase [Lentisphaerae bacterium]|nr:dihydropteroate synthase [Lentisphaerota bacterium]